MVQKLTDNEKIRYDRQIKIKNWGIEKQLLLKKSKVAVIGLGGLGSPASMYLAAVGVGNLVLIDNQEYELSNLNRQILSDMDGIGKGKAEYSTEKLLKLNSDIKIEYKKIKLSENNIEENLKGCDVVLDALDNWSTRFLINKICVKKDIPLIHGGVLELGGQLFTVIPRKGPCLECVFKGVPEMEGGFAVVGVTPGIIGVLQALEVIKIITKIGKPLYDKMLVFDGYETSFEYVSIKRNESCNICGNLSK